MMTGDDRRLQTGRTIDVNQSALEVLLKSNKACGGRMTPSTSAKRTEQPALAERQTKQTKACVMDFA